MTAPDVALGLSLLGAWLVGWGLAALLACYLRPIYAEDDAGSGRLMVD